MSDKYFEQKEMPGEASYKESHKSFERERLGLPINSPRVSFKAECMKRNNSQGIN
jgi:hypothetical protein